MPCYRPLTAFYAKGLSQRTGKRILTFKRTDSVSGKPVNLACGQCVGCRLETARQWAVRCMHEKQMHRHNAFVTLSYEDRYLPPGGSLCRRDLQLFMKRLRKRFGNGIRFYACGEYGDTTNRPHYHLLLFNCRFDDQEPIGRAKGGQTLYRSKDLSELWPYGLNWIGDVTFESAAYVARYILKKVTGEPAADHYSGREPEFTVMSRRPGIAAIWYSKFGQGVRDHDSVVMSGREQLPPRFYDLRFELLDKIAFEGVKRERRRRAILFKEESSPRRRFVREQLVAARKAEYMRRM